MALAIGFVIVAVALCVLALIALFPVTEIHMSRVDAIERDGLARGRHAPSWRLVAHTGAVVSSPPARPFQLVLFTDHSLKSFPSVIDGIRELLDEPKLEIVVLTQRAGDMAGQVLRILGLGSVPVVPGSRSLYARYNVRVTPFAIFVDDQRRARSSSLVNHDWQLERLWSLAQVPISVEQRPKPIGRRLSRPGAA